MISVLLITGESFCGHCRRAIKLLKEIYPELMSRNIKIIHYDVRVRNEEAIKKLKEKYDIPWEVRPCTADFVKMMKQKYEALYVPLMEINGEKVPFEFDKERLLSKILEYDAISAS